jgi:DNA repair protein RecO (recombination protein O)
LKQTDYGIVLHRLNYSESSVIITLFTQNKGIKRFIFQGGKKKNSAIFPMNHIEFTYYARPDSELGKMTEAFSSGISNEIPFDPIKASIAFFLADVVKQCIKTEEQDKELFDFLENRIHLLNQNSSLSLFPHETLIQLTKYLGLQPQESDGAYFLVQEGLFSDHHQFDSTAEKGEAVDLLRAILKGEVPSNSSTSTRRQTMELILKYFRYHVPNFNVDHSLDIIRETL